MTNLWKTKPVQFMRSHQQTKIKIPGKIHLHARRKSFSTSGLVLRLPSSPAEFATAIVEYFNFVLTQINPHFFLSFIRKSCRRYGTHKKTWGELSIISRFHMFVQLVKRKKKQVNTVVVLLKASISEHEVNMNFCTCTLR